MKTITKTGIVAVVLLVLYVGSYIALSMGGRYEPSAIGLNGVKAYSWAPCGFVRNYKWNFCMQLLYLPLSTVDERIWHSREESFSGRYPVDVVEKKDIWKVYKAWGALTETKPPQKIPEKKQTARPEPQTAKDAIIALVRQQSDIFIGRPNPDRLAECQLQKLDAHRWQFGIFQFDLKTMTYSAMIGEEGPELYLYEGKILQESGHLLAKPPKLTRLHRTPLQ